MNLEVTCWAVSKAHAEAMLQGLGIIEVQPDGSWKPLVRADIKPAVSVPYLTGNMITDAFGNEVPESAERDGFHFDIIYRGQTALNLLRPLPLDADGNLIGEFGDSVRNHCFGYRRNVPVLCFYDQLDLFDGVHQSVLSRVQKSPSSSVYGLRASQCLHVMTGIPLSSSQSGIQW